MIHTIDLDSRAAERLLLVVGNIFKILTATSEALRGLRVGGDRGETNPVGEEHRHKRAGIIALLDWILGYGADLTIAGLDVGLGRGCRGSRCSYSVSSALEKIFVGGG